MVRQRRDRHITSGAEPVVGHKVVRAVLEREAHGGLGGRGRGLPDLEGDRRGVVDCSRVCVSSGKSAVRAEEDAPMVGGRAPSSLTPVMLNKLKKGL